MATPTFHRTATVDGRKIFYREAGDPTAPTILPRLVWLDSGHFVLDENHAQMAAEIKTAFAP